MLDSFTSDTMLNDQDQVVYFVQFYIYNLFIHKDLNTWW